MDFTILLFHNCLILIALGTALWSYHRYSIIAYWVCRAACTLIGIFLLLNAATLLEHRSFLADFAVMAICWRYLGKMRTRVVPSKIKDDNILDADF
jgi:hypothetical protein